MSKNKELVVGAKTSDVARFDFNDGELQELAVLARVDLEQEPEILATLGADELGRAQFSVLRAGAYFIKLKQLVGHGRYLPMLETIGVSPDAAKRAVQVVRYVMLLGANKRERIAKLPKHKILPLVNANPEVVDQLLEDGSLDGDSPLSVRELVKALADEKQRRIKAEALLAPTQQKLKELKGDAPDGIPAAFAAKRDQAAYLISSLDETLQLLATLVEDDLDVQNWRGTEDADGLKAVATVIYHGGNGTGALLQSVLEKIAKVYGASVTADVLPALQYPPQARERLKDLKERALSAAQKGFKNAQTASRAAHKTRGRHS